MKHVFVETNFIVDLLRPFPTQNAARLLARHGQDVTLHVPWCCVHEAKRTLGRIIQEDLAFIDGSGRFLSQLMARHRGAPPFDAAAVRTFVELARSARIQAQYDFEARVDGLAAGLVVIAPSEQVVRRTLALFPIKSLPPFDEMTLGAVLAQASDLHARGERDLFFCNLNRRDFEPTTGNDLANAYGASGICYLDSFAVP